VDIFVLRVPTRKLRDFPLLHVNPSFKNRPVSIFMEPQVSFSCAQEYATGPYSEPV
jgi:hypothetical protein